VKKEKNGYPNHAGQEPNKDDDNLPGYPAYPEDEDIYNIYMEESDIDPEDIHKTKDAVEKNKIRKSLDTDLSDEFPVDDLDVPGSELDDSMEMIGSEDEENNYYSLGGDDHIDLEEDQGE
jgi:hypothetical protein